MCSINGNLLHNHILYKCNHIMFYMFLLVEHKFCVLYPTTYVTMHCSTSFLLVEHKLCSISHAICYHVLFYMNFLGRAQLVFYIPCHMSPHIVLHVVLGRAQLVFYISHDIYNNFVDTKCILYILLITNKNVIFLQDISMYKTS